MEKQAVIATGGKQYLVKEGQFVRVEKLTGELGAKMEFTDLLNGKTIKASIAEHGKAAKIRIIKFRNKTRYLRRQGHRQPLTILKVEAIG